MNNVGAISDCLRIGEDLRAAFGRSVEEGQRELLVDDADVEVDEAGGGDVDADLADGEPEEELLGGAGTAWHRPR